MNPRQFRKSSAQAALTAGTILATSIFAHGATLEVGPVSLPLETTNWSSTVAVNQFDPAMGTLTGIAFELIGRVFGSARVESRDASPADVTANIAAEISLSEPGGGATPVAITIPTVSETRSLDIFDGALDFAGTSGFSVTDLTGSQTETGSSTNFGLYTGLGTIDLTVSADGASSGSGAGNLTTLFNTSAAAEFRVTYTYDAATGPPPTPSPVPEPSGALALMLVAAGMTARRRR